MLDIHTYSRLELVRAHQYAGGTMEMITLIDEADNLHYDQALIVTNSRGEEEDVCVGDYLIFHSNGQAELVKQDDFEFEYTRL